MTKKGPRQTAQIKGKKLKNAQSVRQYEKETPKLNSQNEYAGKRLKCLTRGEESKKIALKHEMDLQNEKINEYNKLFTFTQVKKTDFPKIKLNDEEIKKINERGFPKIVSTYDFSMIKETAELLRSNKVQTISNAKQIQEWYEKLPNIQKVAYISIANDLATGEPLIDRLKKNEKTGFIRDIQTQQHLTSLFSPVELSRAKARISYYLKERKIPIDKIQTYIATRNTEHERAALAQALHDIQTKT